MGKKMETEETSQDGFALLAVLGFLVIVASVMTTFSIAAHNRLLSTKHDLNQVELTLALDSFDTALRVAWNNARTGETVDVPNRLRCRFGLLELYSEMRPLAGLIDINAAGNDLLQLGLLALGIEASRTKDLSEAILAFRSRSSINTATVVFEPKGGLKHGLYESVSELHDFETLRTITLWQLERVFTVHKRSATLLESQAADELKSVIQTAKQTGFSLPFLQDGVVGPEGFHTTTLARLGKGAWAYRLATYRSNQNGTFQRVDHYKHLLHSSTKALASSVINNEPCINLGLGLLSDDFLQEQA